jgi:hypothetical protein
MLLSTRELKRRAIDTLGEEKHYVQEAKANSRSDGSVAGFLLAVRNRIPREIAERAVRSALIEIEQGGHHESA